MARRASRSGRAFCPRTSTEFLAICARTTQKEWLIRNGVGVERVKQSHAESIRMTAADAAAQNAITEEMEREQSRQFARQLKASRDMEAVSYGVLHPNNVIQTPKPSILFDVESPLTDESNEEPLVKKVSI